MDDPLSGLEIASISTVLDSIVEGAYQSLSLIQPWCKARTDNPVLMKVVGDIRRHGLVYCKAIDKSIDTAQEGFDFSSDAIGLCDHLLDKDTNLEDLREYISEMQCDARHAREGSTEVLGRFRAVREGLTEVMKGIPKAVAVKAEGNKSKYSIRIPFFNSNGEKKRDVGLEDAIKELNLAAINLATLSEGVDAFAGWWVGMEMTLKAVENGAYKLKPGENRLKIQNMQKRWKMINGEYMEYKVKIVKLQDHYPPHELELPVEGSHLKNGRAPVGT